MPETTEERNKKLMAIPGYIVLIKKPNEPDTWYGPIERSFSLDVQKWRTQFFWTADNVYSNIGTGPHKVDGFNDAQQSMTYWKNLYPDWEFHMYNAREPESLPVVIDWDKWLDAEQPAENKFSLVKNKFDSRNLYIYPKEPAGSPPSDKRAAKENACVDDRFTPREI